jgi:hypothetical protein
MHLYTTSLSKSQVVLFKSHPMRKQRQVMHCGDVHVHYIVVCVRFTQLLSSCYVLTYYIFLNVKYTTRISSLNLQLEIM